MDKILSLIVSFMNIVTIRRDAAAMGHACKRFQRGFHRCAAGTVVQLRDQAEAAAVPLVARVVQAH